MTEGGEMGRWGGGEVGRWGDEGAGGQGGRGGRRGRGAGEKVMVRQAHQPG